MQSEKKEQRYGYQTYRKQSCTFSKRTSNHKKHKRWEILRENRQSPCMCRRTEQEKEQKNYELPKLSSEGSVKGLEGLPEKLWILSNFLIAGCCNRVSLGSVFSPLRLGGNCDAGCGVDGGRCFGVVGHLGEHSKTEFRKVDTTINWVWSEKPKPM